MRSGPVTRGRPAHAAMVTRWIPTNSNSCSGRAFHFQTQLYGFANALGDLVKGPRLRVACGELGNRGYVIAF